MKLQQVHLRINDAATGQPTPVRLRITDADGRYYAPYGRLTEFAAGVNQDVGGNVLVGGKNWAYIDGTCEILLPPGPLHVEVTKGPEYKPINEHITLLAGKMSLRLSMERWSDVRTQGWHSGDTRVHFLSPDAALLEGQAEDVAIVNLLVTETEVTDSFGKSHLSVPNILSFSGQHFARQAPGCGVAVNTENAHAKLGSLGLLHCHRVVYPLSFAGEEWTLDDWCGQCHRKKGLVVWTNPQHQTAEFLYGEPLADLILGNLDAFELTFFEDSPFDVLADYYRLLDAELVTPLVGASGKDSNGIAIGSMRTYAYLRQHQEFNYTNWIEAVRVGQTFVSNGPLLHLTINDQVPTKTCGVSSAEGHLHLRAEAKCFHPFEHLELIWNGKAVADVSPTESSPYHAVLEWDLPLHESGWLAARCRGDMQIPSRPAPQRLFAHSSAVAVRVTESPHWSKAPQVENLLHELDAMLGWANLPPRRERLFRILELARTTLAKKLSR